MSKTSKLEIVESTVSTTPAKTISKRDFLKTILTSVAFFSLGGIFSLFQPKSTSVSTPSYGSRQYGM